jgi:hypothetical protein
MKGRVGMKAKEKAKKLVDKAKEKLGKIFGDVADALSPQPELVPIPIPADRPRRPQRRGNYHGW